MSARTILKHVYENGGMTQYQYERIDRVLKEQRPHGEWIDTGYGTVRCSVCGTMCQTYPRDKYCSWCGADMRKEGEPK